MGALSGESSARFAAAGFAEEEADEGDADQSAGVEISPLSSFIFKRFCNSFPPDNIFIYHSRVSSDCCSAVVLLCGWMDGCDDDESLFRSALEFLFVLPALIHSFVHSLAQLLFNIVVVGKSRTGHFHGFSLFVVCCSVQGIRFSRARTPAHTANSLSLCF